MIDDHDRPVLRLEGASQRYRLPRTHALRPAPTLTALDHATLEVRRGEAVGIVGESGSGKSTLTRLLAAQERPSSGYLSYDRTDVWAAPRSFRRLLRRRVQVVLQNPRASFDPRMRMGTSLAEPLRALRIGGDRRARIVEVLHQVGMDIDALDRFPHEFSGGQLQRLAIARALAPGPDFLIADEPVSALDVSIRAQVLNLLRDLVDRLGIALVLVAHDLSVVSYVTDRVLVVADGHIVEEGEARLIFTEPRAEATRALVDAVLLLDQPGRRR